VGLEEKLPSGVLLTSVEKLGGWAWARSVWPATFGLACCAIELFQTGSPQHDLARFGMEIARNTPAAGGPDDRGRAGQPEDGPGAPADLRPDA
jgi:NADH:ubiquinone oxidoreductase subunit B-like Fe-S oxidoreductase